MGDLNQRQRALCLAAPPSGDLLAADLTELKELLDTAGADVAGEIIQHREYPHPNLYLGPGKLDEVEQAIKELDADFVVCDDELSARQERNLEERLKVSVVDRTALILDIFAKHAHTAEGKLQVELAQLEYNMARMRGLWTHLERLGGGVGTRGPGETQIETDRRLARNRISALKRRLAQVGASRSVMRLKRDGAGLPQVALAGYTNAGKSTLLNALCGSEVEVEDRLFHTLDPTTRSTEIDGQRYLLTDTVGFIRKLPHQLVDAFAATLEETRLADLLIHVIDGSAPEERIDEMYQAVERVLKEIGADEQPQLVVVNKLDAMDDDARQNLNFRFDNALFVSAKTGEGIDHLRSEIKTRFRSKMQLIELLIPYNKGAILAELHGIAEGFDREDTEQGVRIKARLLPQYVGRFERFVVKPD